MQNTGGTEQPSNAIPIPIHVYNTSIAIPPSPSSFNSVGGFVVMPPRVANPGITPTNSPAGVNSSFGSNNNGTPCGWSGSGSRIAVGHTAAVSGIALALMEEGEQ